jgi:uridine kinase
MDSREKEAAMRGDILITGPQHRRAAAVIAGSVMARIERESRPVSVGIAGESGSGKSEIAQALQEILAEHGIPSAILQQDDYFVYPPRSNDARRRENIEWVGPQEVHLDRLAHDVGQIVEGSDSIVKPIVIYQEDRVSSEVLEVRDFKAVIVEGTYVSLLESLDIKVFIDRDYHQTREARNRRGREKPDPFIERVLEIEHKIISHHKALASVIVNPDYSVRNASTEGVATEN